MDVHDGRMAGRIEQRVALRHRLAEAGADRQDQVRLAGARHQRGVGGDAKVADIIVERAVVQRLAAEGDGHRQVVGDEEAADIGARLFAPACAAQDGQRLARARQQGVQALQRGRIGMRAADRRAADIAHLDRAPLHLLGERDHHRTGPAGGGDVHRMRHQFGDAGGIVDLGDPLGQRLEHPPVVDFLEAFAVGFRERDLADEQQQGGGILERHVYADGGVAGAGAAGDEGGGRAAGELAADLGHVHGAGLEAAGGEVQLLAHGIQPVEDVEVAFAGHGEGMGDALRHQRVRHQAPAGARRQSRSTRLWQFHGSAPHRLAGLQ